MPLSMFVVISICQQYDASFEDYEKILLIDDLMLSEFSKHKKG